MYSVPATNRRLSRRHEEDIIRDVGHERLEVIHTESLVKGCRRTLDSGSVGDHNGFSDGSGRRPAAASKSDGSEYNSG